MTTQTNESKIAETLTNFSNVPTSTQEPQKKKQKRTTVLIKDSDSEVEYSDTESINDSSDDVEEASLSEDMREEEETQLFNQQINRTSRNITRTPRSTTKKLSNKKEYCYCVKYLVVNSKDTQKKNKMFIYDKPTSIKQIETLLKKLTNCIEICIIKVKVIEQIMTE
jgi:hypothetical protein